MGKGDYKAAYEKLVKLFDEYSEEFGIGDEGALANQCDFECAFNEIICETQGHEFVPDHCLKPEHDFCVRCHIRREDFEKGES